ncbi:LptA/OstA family protein [Sphingomonas japonica]|uniref:Lipopolysaccharide export system protein LptA n=1 Tax=Sphingomonas japonica TaxID=511662 RepID=A0ABX0U0B4_9SPHN|nr:LptA/OstA family protein [Sphingomonas japonica]NIJ24008.1 lipopolysaccharide export system protein LptA [Sphingomonas japonica]
MQRRLVLIALPVLAGMGFAGSAVAQRHDSTAPIDFSAQTIELQDRANRAVLSGGVTIRQANMTLTAARMTVAYTGQVLDGSPQVSRLDGSGGVTVDRPGQKARSQYAVYDINARVITMIGDVTLNESGNTINGGRLSINLDTGRATINGSTVGGTGTQTDSDGTIRQNGRVTGRFSVPDRN